MLLGESFEKYWRWDASLVCISAVVCDLDIIGGKIFLAMQYRWRTRLRSEGELDIINFFEIGSTSDISWYFIQEPHFMPTWNMDAICVSYFRSWKNQQHQKVVTSKNVAEKLLKFKTQLIAASNGQCWRAISTSKQVKHVTSQQTDRHRRRCMTDGADGRLISRLCSNWWGVREIGKGTFWEIRLQTIIRRIKETSLWSTHNQFRLSPAHIASRERWAVQAEKSSRREIFTGQDGCLSIKKRSQCQ